MGMGTTVMPIPRPATCLTLFSMRIRAQALAQPRQDPWAQAPTAVELQPAGRPAVGHLRAGHQPVELQLVESLPVEQVWN